MDQSSLNKFNQSLFINPEEALKRLRTMHSLEAVLSDLQPGIRHRAPRLKREREIRQACLFAYGMSHKIGQPVLVHPIEESDFDFLAAWEVPPLRHFAPVQLKEVVPHHRNIRASLQSVIDGLLYYRSCGKLTVAIHLNRAGRFRRQDIVVPKLDLAALWIFGAMSQDQSRWYLFGNLLEEPECTLFEYPA